MGGSVRSNNETIPVVMDQILNWKQSVLTRRISMAGADSTCKVMKFPTFMTGVAGAKIQRLMRVAMNVMENGYSCMGSANGLDTYTLDFPPSWLPLPSPVKVHTVLDVDQNLPIVHKETETEDFDMKGTKAHVESTFISEENSAGGPTEDEMLVPES